MSTIAIVTDSCASIPDALIEKLNIHWVPYYIHHGTEVLRDLVTAKRDAFYSWLKTATVLPTTASPGPGDYLKMYQELANEGYQGIISIHMTSKGSGAYQAAKAAESMAREMLPKLQLEIVDTLNVAMGHGWMVIEAARAALEGKSLSEVSSIVKEMIPVTRMIQTADTLKYLYMGGRIGRAKHLVGTILNIKPLIGMEDGEIIALGTARSRKRAYLMMVERIEAAVGYMGKIKIAYMHAAAGEEVEKIKTLVEQRLDVIEEIITELSPALGVHAGPGTAGVCYYPVNIDKSRQ